MTFLQSVARDIIAKHPADQLASLAVVFPNKRASLFLNQALCAEAGKPIWSPAYITISDLFRKQSTLEVPDELSLIFTLYRVYQQETGSQEPLDQFFSWGKVMLDDFDDIDKQLVEADKLFINVEDWQDKWDLPPLTESQRQSIEEFFGTVMDKTALQQRFMETWKHLDDIYHSFRKTLSVQGQAYEGMLYRTVVEGFSSQSQPTASGTQYTKYIFVGFNALSKVEQRLFMLLKDMGKAEFYWDYDNFYMDSPVANLPKDNTVAAAGSNIARWLTMFPNELSEGRRAANLAKVNIYDNLARPKSIAFASAQTEDIQARYASQWLKAQGRAEAGNRTAIILADETLLQAVIHCLPEEVKSVNITAGWPLLSSPISSFVQCLINLQLRGGGNANTLRGKYVNRILSHPYARFLSDQCAPLLQELTDNHIHYPTRKYLTEGRAEEIKALFARVDDGEGTPSLLQWMTTMVKLVGIGSRATDDPLIHEAIFRMHTLLNRLYGLMVVVPECAASMPMQQGAGRQPVSMVMLQRVLWQIVEATTIPFHGEPATGVQVMGVLETRNLDFEHVLLLSCNEGKLPKGLTAPSLIPYVIRKGYEMTTADDKASIYAYHFLSMLQRAGDVTIAYNSSTADGKQGEMSRFMLQWLVDKPKGQDVEMLTLQPQLAISALTKLPVVKDELVMKKLDSLEALSPTAINRYLRCPLQFYYNTVCSLREPDNDDEDLDNRSFGNIFHKAAQMAYWPMRGRTVTKEYINGLQDNAELLSHIIDKAFRSELFKLDDSAPMPKYNGLQMLDKKIITLYLKKLLELDYELAPFDIISLEEKYLQNITFDAGGKSKTLSVGGQIDRLDCINTQQSKDALIRVIDYKTGAPSKAFPSCTEDIFNPEYVDARHTNYYLQTFLYASIVREQESAIYTQKPAADIPVAPALLFVRQASGNDYDPILKYKGAMRGAKPTAINDIRQVEEEFTERLKNLLSEIFNPDLPFQPTPYPTRCDNCPYRDFCGS